MTLIPFLASDIRIMMQYARKRDTMLVNAFTY